MNARGAGPAGLAWPALVLTAGLATRLQPLSSVRAKAALPVAGRPLIARILQWLHDAGVRRAVLNLHHRPDSITTVVGDGTQFDMAVRYSWEREVLGSAGGPARAIPLLESDRFLIVNGDTLTDVDLHALCAQHVDTNALVTMAVVDADPRYNAIVADAAGIVTAFASREPATREPANRQPANHQPANREPANRQPENPEPENREPENPTFGTLGTSGTPGTALRRFHFIGVQVVNASVFAGVSPDHKAETVHGIYPGLIASRPGAVRIFHTTREFHDIGSPRDYLHTASTFAEREGRPLDRGVDVAIAADAALSNTILWDRVTVGAGARLTNCVVADDVHVPEGAAYENCSLVMRGHEMIVTPFQWIDASSNTSQTKKSTRSP
ncbi:MAG TPA: sugar phosphate nucleotidyltransferase [Vicinamibacterales bacterium]|nr:sugar phosphate nucleotidyltransferase [Vicinamibacterales bacterium]